jgi:ATP-binding cassette subfamily B protein
VRERIRFRLAVLRIFRYGGRMIPVGIALQVLAGLMPVAFIVTTSAVIGRVPGAVHAGLGSPEWRSLRNVLLLAGALFVVQQVIGPLQFMSEFMLAWNVDDRLRERAAAASFGPIGVGAIEDSETYETLADLAYAERGTGFSPGAACWGTFLLFAMYLQWTAAAVLIGIVYAWWAALLLAAGSLTMRIAIRSGFGKHQRYEKSFHKLRRRRSYFRDLITTVGAGKEIRVFGLRPWLRDHYRETALAALHPVWRSRRRLIYGSYAVSSPVWLVRCAVATVGAARAAAHGSLTIGELAFVLQGISLLGSIGSFNDPADYQTEWGLVSFVGLEELERRVADEETAAQGVLSAAGTPRESIQFDGVVFGYGERPVLRSLDLTIEAGKSLAIVGLNGAGKTTLVKLLARLYEPQSGRILVDGRPLTDYPVREWRRRVAAIFQDFVHYDLPVRDNVGFGAVELLHDDEKVRASLARAGALDFVDELPHGIETTLARGYEDGAELSGGQWQRIAIARAMMAVEAGASVLVLDEPTANLDVRAEAVFFDRFLELTRGLTTVLISHRFSTVRRADRIVVLEEGHVIEDGTHEQLLALDGRYAELFHLQAARFQA